MKATSTALKASLALTTVTVLALGGVSVAQAATLTHDAWGTNYSVVCTGYDALQFNATRNPGEGGPPFAGNTLLMLSDVTYWYPNYPCYESTTWTSNGTGRKAAKVSGAYMNLDAIDPADFYVRTDRFIKLRNLTVDNILTFNGASVAIADSAGKLKIEVLDVFGSNSIALPQEYSPTNYSVTAGVVLMEPDSILTRRSAPPAATR